MDFDEKENENEKQLKVKMIGTNILVEIKPKKVKNEILLINTSGKEGTIDNDLSDLFIRAIGDNVNSYTIKNSINKRIKVAVGFKYPELPIKDKEQGSVFIIVQEHQILAIYQD